MPDDAKLHNLANPSAKVLKFIRLSKFTEKN